MEGWLLVLQRFSAQLQQGHTDGLLYNWGTLLPELSSAGLVGEDISISRFFPFTQHVFIEHILRVRLCAKSNL